MLAWMTLQRAASFPALSVGAYVGRMSGVTEKKNEFVSLYVERIGSARALLFVVFDEGWKPQIVPLVSTQGSTGPSDPITIAVGERQFILQGTEGHNEFSGTVISADGAHGVWSLQPISNEQLRKDITASESGFDFNQWIALRSTHRAKTREKELLEHTIADRSDKQEKLEKYVSEEKGLRVRAQERREQLEGETTNRLEKEKQMEQEVRNSARDLEQLIRITKRGRAVELARRVSKREDKWYLVNWQKGEDFSTVEESLAEKMNVDLRRLKENVRRAEELNALKNTIEKEHDKIVKLEILLQERSEGAKRPPEHGRPTPKAEPDPERPWWKSWDSMFN